MIKVGLLIVFSLFSAFLTWMVINLWAKRYIKKELKVADNYLNELPWLVFVSGFIEILLYSLSFLIGKPEFIVFWVGVKTALKWDRKGKKEKGLPIEVQRGTYHNFLLGTGLNIIFGYITACLVNGDFMTYLR